MSYIQAATSPLMQVISGVGQAYSTDRIHNTLKKTCHDRINCNIIYIYILCCPLYYALRIQLAPDDAWKCPHCKQLQQGMVQMSLWTLPDILILHLKRFRQVGERRNKLSTLVRFPLTALDMAPHMVKRSNCTRLPSTWKHQRTETNQHPEDFLYDLYAVCNHHGGMHGGHYTGLWTDDE